MGEDDVGHDVHATPPDGGACVLAVMRGRVDGAMTCWQDTAGPYYLLTDTAKCWAPEINATFDGKLTACSGGLVYADSDAGCYTTIANINKDAEYKGPPISCGHDRTDGYHWYLAWKSADNCANGITALMEVLDPNVHALRSNQTAATRLNVTAAAQVPVGGGCGSPCAKSSDCTSGGCGYCEAASGYCV